MFDKVPHLVNKRRTWPEGPSDPRLSMDPPIDRAKRISNRELWCEDCEPRDLEYPEQAFIVNSSDEGF